MLHCSFIHHPKFVAKLYNQEMGMISKYGWLELCLSLFPRMAGLPLCMPALVVIPVMYNCSSPCVPRWTCKTRSSTTYYLLVYHSQVKSKGKTLWPEQVPKSMLLSIHPEALPTDYQSCQWASCLACLSYTIYMWDDLENALPRYENVDIQIQEDYSIT